MSERTSKTAKEDSSKTRDFWVRLPAACGVPDEVAEIEGEANGKKFDLELKNPGSVYRRRQGQPTRARLSPGFLAWSHLADSKTMAYGIDLACFMSDCRDVNRAGEKHPKALIAEAARLQKLEPEFPAISALYTVEEASVLSNWA